MRSFLASLLLFSAPSLAAPSQFGIDSGSVPEKLPIEGKVVAHTRFHDVDGNHVVLVTETELKEVKGSRTKKLFGYQFDEKSGRWTQLWRTQDFVNDCEFDLTLAYVEGSLQVTDLNGNHRAETRFTYKLGCRSDVSPLQVKVLLHEGSTKYALRGETVEPAGVDASGKTTYTGGSAKADDALRNGPKAFLDAARADFNRAKQGLRAE